MLDLGDLKLELADLGLDAACYRLGEECVDASTKGRPVLADAKVEVRAGEHAAQSTCSSAAQVVLAHQEGNLQHAVQVLRRVPCTGGPGLNDELVAQATVLCLPVSLGDWLDDLDLKYIVIPREILELAKH